MRKMDNTLSRRTVLKAALAAVPLLSAPSFTFAAGAGGKTLVLYFSHSGNTRKIAEMVHRQVGGELLQML